MRRTALGTPRMIRVAMAMVLFLVLGSSCGGCSEEENNISGEQSGSLVVRPNPVVFEQVPIGERSSQLISLENAASEPLRIFEIALKAREGGSADELEFLDIPQLPLEIEGRGIVDIELEYVPAEGKRTLANIEIISSDPSTSRDEPTTVLVNTLANRPELLAQPNVVRFTRLLPGDNDEMTVEVINIGSAPLTIYEASYSGGSDFRLADEEELGLPVTLGVYEEAKAAEDPEKYVLPLRVLYRPGAEGGDSGQLQIVSNDLRDPLEGEEGRGVTFIDVLANADAPCILVDNTNRNFGQTPVGTAGNDILIVENCGQRTLEINSLKITENTDDDEFELLLGGLDANNDGDIDDTIFLEPGQQRTFGLKYIPAQEGTDNGAITIQSNDPVQSNLEVSLVGRGAVGQCPTAVALASIDLEAGPTVPREVITAVPLQYIILDGSQSSDPDGNIPDSNYKWEVIEQPEGTFAQLRATPDDPNDMDPSRRYLRLLTAGKYKIKLTVEDAQGFESCEPDFVEITAIPNEKVHIELTWTNPGDDDETDETGSDIDLHLVKMGPGRWFEAPYDIYYNNANNGLGSENNQLWSPETPSLDIDDTDGGGPENIQMDDPAPCSWYAVGVHYFKQNFGTAYVTVRIYINGALVYEKPNKALTRGLQFWDVARIHWDQGAQIIDVDNLADIQPQGQPPAVTAGMVNSGLCTDVPLY